MCVCVCVCSHFIRVGCDSVRGCVYACCACVCVCVACLCVYVYVLAHVPPSPVPHRAKDLRVVRILHSVQQCVCAAAGAACFCIPSVYAAIHHRSAATPVDLSTLGTVACFATLTLCIHFRTWRVCVLFA